MTNLSPEQIKELRELHTNASGGTWSSDLHGLYVTTDECPLCTPRYQGRGNIMLTSAPVSLDAGDKELIQIRGWGHLQKHKGGERVQKANANLIAAGHNSLPALLSMAERCVVLEEQVKRLEAAFDGSGAAYRAHCRATDEALLNGEEFNIVGPEGFMDVYSWRSIEEIRAAVTPTNNTKDNGNGTD